MSWGERSCLKPCRNPNGAEISTCNVDCLEYIWDGVTAKDSIATLKNPYAERYASSQKNKFAIGAKYRCPKCGGTGRVERKEKFRSCYNCDGTGRMSEKFKS